MRNLPAASISLFAGTVADPTEVILFPTIPTLKGPSFTAEPSNSRTLFIDRSIIFSLCALLHSGSDIRSSQGDAIAKAPQWQTAPGDGGVAHT
jgi:hypothetical protein